MKYLIKYNESKLINHIEFLSLDKEVTPFLKKESDKILNSLSDYDLKIENKNKYMIIGSISPIINIFKLKDDYYKLSYCKNTLSNNKVKSIYYQIIILLRIITFNN